MKVGFLVAEFPKASETFVSRELLTLRAVGVDVTAFSFRAPGAKEIATLDPMTRSLAAEVGYIDRGQFAAGLCSCCRSPRRMWSENRALQKAVMAPSNEHLRLLRAGSLARALEKARIDHLHVHWPYATQIAYLVHKLTGIPFSVSIHAHEVEHDYGHFPRVFEALSFAAFCNRAAMERLLARLPVTARSKSHLVYHGVDLERFSPLPFPTASTPLRVVSAGRLTPTKGFDRLVAACGKFHADGGAVELTILGDGDMASSLRQQATRLGFEKQLHLTGWLPHDQVAAEITRSHLFALMADTNFHDGLPNVVLEAMASARPVVLSPLPAAGEAVTDGVEGFVLNAADDIAGMVHALQIASAGARKLEQMGAAARQRVAQVFDQNVHARQLQTLLDQTSRVRQTVAVT